LLGIFGEPPQVDLSERVIMQGLRLHGIYGRRIYDTWERTQSLLRSGALDVSPIITHRLDLAEWEQAFDLIASRHAGKVVLVP
jgi:threonine 3-dehydrogenase